MRELIAGISENLARIRRNISAAAARSHRRAEEIKLVAVTKSVGTAEIRALVAAGCMDFGESRPQQLWQKADQLADLPIRWHLIGHLQRNKARRTLPLVSMIHSADSLRLIETIDENAAELGTVPIFASAKMGMSPLAEGGASTKMGLSPLGRRVPLLLEVNTSGESAKGGFRPEEIEPLLPEMVAFRHIDIRGLMCMAALEGGGEAARRDFAALRQLRDRLLKSCPPEIILDELSMGMSGDYEEAIEEGATIVRIGTALFEGDCPL